MSAEPARTTNLTQHPSPFVGRSADLAVLRQRFVAGDRLVVVVGTAGVGKTRVAREVARALLPSYADPGMGGLWWCDLTLARDPEDVCRCIAQELGIALHDARGPGDAAQHVGRVLSARGRVLLVLDNFEQVAAHAGAAVRRWMAQAPGACFLVTSRERLGVDGEVTHFLAPLSLPGSGGESEAVELFAVRARAVRHDFSLETHRSAVEELVTRLDGIPLAIELAAARSSVLLPAQILKRVGQRFELLSNRGPTGAAVDHHRTLRDAIAWSWDLLDAAEQSALARCAVFQGGFSLEAAEAVLSPGPEATILDIVQALHDKSLIHGDVHPDFPDEIRYSLFESVRVYAREKLAASGQERAAMAGHAAHYVSASGGWVGTIYRAGGPDGLRRLVLERDNLAAVVHRALEASDPAPARAIEALEAALALDAVVEAHGPWPEYCDLLGATIAYAASVGDSGDAGRLTAALAAAVVARSAGLRRLGRVDEAISELEDVLERVRDHGDLPTQIRVLAQLGGVRSYGTPEAARRHFQEALAIAGPLNDPRVEGPLRSRIAAAEHLWGDYDEVCRQAQRALELLRLSGDGREEAWTLIFLSQAYGELGDFERARTLCVRVAEIARRAGNRWLEMFTIHVLAAIAVEEVRLEDALALDRQVIELARQVGDQWFEGVARMYHARLLHEMHPVGGTAAVGVSADLDEARSEYERGLAILVTAGDLRNEALCRAGLAALDARSGRADQAQAALDAAERITSQFQNPLLSAVVSVWRGHLELARARQAVAARDEKAAARFRKAAEARLIGQEALARAEDGRAALRLLRRALEEARSIRGLLEVAKDGTWFRIPSGKRVELRRQKALRAMIVHLTQARLERPGQPTSLSDLFAAGWPEERVRPESQQNRVYVALTTFRNLGLRDVLLSSDEGWLLDPVVQVILVDG